MELRRFPNGRPGLDRSQDVVFNGAIPQIAHNFHAVTDISREPRAVERLSLMRSELASRGFGAISTDRPHAELLAR